uniref:Uncharacterized protein n=1 Tax=Brassica campestris TaxID=3711 RepID=A0A3P6DPH2_BRACM|nr:unnamed protein product [Brassica rapa]
MSKCIGRGAFRLRGSNRASGGGRSGSENVGLSNANIGENQCPENPRVPPQGSSTEERKVSLFFRVRRVEKMPRANVRVPGATALK